MEANLRILQSFKKINEKIEDNEKKQKKTNEKVDEFLKNISKEIKELDPENEVLKKELGETIEKVKQEKPKDGKDGIDGRDGKDGYTPIKNKDYFDGKDGKDGINGKDGKNGKDGADGKDGQDGLDGVSVYDAEINEKGELILKLTNGKKINCGVVKGKDGIGFNGVGVSKAEVIDGHLIITLTTGKTIDAGLINSGEEIPTKLSQLENDSGFVEKEDLKKSKFIIKEYATYDDLPKPLISYSYSYSFSYQWGPPEDYCYYVDGKWVTDVDGIGLSINNPQYLYTPEDLANVTCKITSELPTDLYPDITEDSFSLSMAYNDITPSYISANYYPVLTTSYGDYEHNPYTLGLNLSFDIILPPKPNSEVAEDVIYKVLDTNKCYILDTDTNEWIEFDETVLNLIPVMNFIDNTKQDKLVSGQNIATINNQSLLNGGNLDLVTSSDLSSYLLKSYVRNSRSTVSSGYAYDVRYINNMVKTSRTTSSYNTYDCTYINGLIKTSKQSSNNYTYSCNYINNNFLTLDTLPKWDGGNE